MCFCTRGRFLIFPSDLEVLLNKLSTALERSSDVLIDCKIRPCEWCFFIDSPFFDENVSVVFIWKELVRGESWKRMGVGF